MPSETSRHTDMDMLVRKATKSSPLQPNTQESIALHNLPREFGREDVLSLLASKGCLVLARFLYLPLDSASGHCLGFAFVALLDAEAADRTRALLDGLMLSGGKALRVTWSTPCRSLDDQVQRFRNSPLMHPSVPDCMRPVMLSEGFRVPFPAPKKKLRAPRMRDHDRLQPWFRKTTFGQTTA